MIEYLQTPDQDLWRHAEDMNAFIWSDDESTIAMPEEVAAILAPLRMALSGLPSLTAILFVIAGLRGGVDDAAREAWRRRLQLLAGTTRVDTVAQWLTSLPRLPTDLRRGVQATCVLLRCGLDDCGDELIEVELNQSDQVLDILELPWTDRQLITEGEIVWPTRLRKSPRCQRAWATLLHLSRAGLDAKTLRTWQETGLKTLPTAWREPPLPPPPRDPINRLLGELADDADLGALARASRSVSAFVSLPRRPSDPDWLPIGGVSDVTNRGHPERLLITELAADPMLLLARIASGQALYLNHETPPGPSPSRRPIAIESGVRCWGTTRVWMTALALAMAASEERRGDTRAEFWTVTGEEYIPEDLTTREGLSGQLARLDLAAHPGPAIAAWDEMLRAQVGDEHGMFAEPLVIVSEATDQDAAFTSSTRGVTRPFLIATIARDGMVQLSRRSVLGDERLQRLKIELPDPPQAIKPTGIEKQPLFLNLQYPPLAFSADSKVVWGCSVFAGDGSPLVWLLTRDRRLLSSTSRLHGCSEEISYLPSSNVLAHQWRDGWLSLVLGGSEARHNLIRCNAQTQQMMQVRLPEDFKSADYSFVDDVLLRFDDGEYQAISTLEGGVIEQGSRPGRHLGSGFVLSAHGQIARYDAVVPGTWHHLAEVPPPSAHLLGTIVMGANGEAVEIAQDLSYVRLLGNETQKVLTGFLVRSIHRPVPIVSDPTGRWWVVSYAEIESAESIAQHRDHDTHFFRIDTHRGAVAPVSDNDFRMRLWATQMLPIQQKSVRTQFRAVAMTRDGLRLLHANRVGRIKEFDQPIPHLKLTPSQEGSRRNFVNFESTRDRKQRTLPAWTLKSAKVAGGTVWLDSRGLLHLQRDDDPRELTLVIVDGHIAGWASVGGFFGPRFFSPVDYGVTEDVPVPDAVITWLDEWSAQT